MTRQIYIEHALKRIYKKKMLSSIVVRNSTPKMDKWDHRETPGPLHI
jgi:hypothetical protein